MLCSKCNHPAKALPEDNRCEACLDEAETRRQDIVELARAQRQEEGSLEIDDTADVSEGDDNGCYVAAWVWVDFAGTPFTKEKEIEHE